LEQWEEDEEPIPPDELPEGHPDRPQPPIDFSKNVNIINTSVGDPRDILVRIRSGSSDPYLLLTDPDPTRDPTPFLISLSSVLKI
jgi:hypothetical protein